MPHYYSEKQSSPLILKLVKIKLKKIEFELYSASGVFSKDKLDKGTEVLINNAKILQNSKTLDLGCGYGTVGISIKLLYPNSQILMTDVNERAVALAKKNIKHLKLQNISAKKSNAFENIDEKFDSILINPPQTAGKKICFNLIENSINFLKANGNLQLVARHKKGGLSLKEKMMETFFNVDEIVKKSGYRVYLSSKPAKSS